MHGKNNVGVYENSYSQAFHLCKQSHVGVEDCDHRVSPLVSPAPLACTFRNIYVIYISMVVHEIHMVKGDALIIGIDTRQICPGKISTPKERDSGRLCFLSGSIKCTTNNPGDARHAHTIPNQGNACLRRVSVVPATGRFAATLDHRYMQVLAPCSCPKNNLFAATCSSTATSAAEGADSILVRLLLGDDDALHLQN